MSLLTSSIDLDMIVSPSQKTFPFHPSQVERLANLFLQAGGTVKPILLRRVSPISFELLEGYFEYFAALKAQEIDEQFTAIRAYVVPPELESTILAQYQFLRSLSSPIPIEESTQTDLDQLETAIANRLEQKLAATLEQIVEKRINSSLQSFANQITQQLDTHLLDIKLDIKNSLSSAPTTKTVEPIIQPPDLSTETVPQKTVKTPAKSKTKSENPSATAKKQNLDDDPKALHVLNDLNTMNFADLERKLSQLKPSKRSLAKPIREQRLQQPEQKFQSIADLMDKVDAIKKPTMQKIIDSW